MRRRQWGWVCHRCVGNHVNSVMGHMKCIAFCEIGLDAVVIISKVRCDKRGPG